MGMITVPKLAILQTNIFGTFVNQVERLLASVMDGSKPSFINFTVNISKHPFKKPLLTGGKGWLQRSLNPKPCEWAGIAQSV